MLINESTALLIRHGETRADAEKMARSFVLSYSQKAGGQQLYFCKDLKFEEQQKRNTIRADFCAGITVFQLSDKYNLSTARIYQVIKQKEIELTETDTSLKAPLMIEAVRILLKAGIEKEDAISAARGLIAVVLARFSGIILLMPKQDKTKTIIKNIGIYRLHKTGKSIRLLAEIFKLSEQEITTIVETYPAPTMPDTAELPVLRKRLFSMAESFREINPDVYDLLESAGDNVARALEMAMTEDNGKDSLTGRIEHETT